MRGPIFTVPNQLTFLRLAFLPFFIIFIYYNKYGYALGILIAAGLSDLLDGLLARRLDQKSELGAYLDPIADKLLLSSSFFLLALKDQFDWWLTILVLSRDVLILIAAAVILAVFGYRPLPPSIFGKATTFAQILLVFAALLAAVIQWPSAEMLRDTLVYVVAGLTVFSGLHYSVVIARRLSGHGK